MNLGSLSFCSATTRPHQSLGIKDDAALAAYLKGTKRPLSVDFDFGSTKLMDK